MNKLKCQSKPQGYVKSSICNRWGWKNHSRDQTQGYQDTRKQDFLEDKLNEAI